MTMQSKLCVYACFGVIEDLLQDDFLVKTIIKFVYGNPGYVNVFNVLLNYTS